MFLCRDGGEEMKTLQETLNLSCQIIEIDPALISSSSRKMELSETRCLIAHILMDELKVDANEISKLFGGRSVTQVQYLASRGSKKVKLDEATWLKKAVIMRAIND